MSDLDAEEARYLENPQKYIANLEKELGLERALQERRRDEMEDELKWVKPRTRISPHFYTKRSKTDLPGTHYDRCKDSNPENKERLNQ